MYAVRSVSKHRTGTEQWIADSWSLEPKQNTTKLNYMYDLISQKELAWGKGHMTCRNK